jgi:hypothetical protein
MAAMTGRGFLVHVQIQTALMVRAVWLAPLSSWVSATNNAQLKAKGGKTPNPFFC